MQLLRSGRSFVRDAPQESARRRGHVGMIVSPAASHKWWAAPATDTTHHSMDARGTSPSPRPSRGRTSLAFEPAAFAQCRASPIDTTGHALGTARWTASDL